MQYLSPEQLRVLNACRESVPFKSLSENDQKICRYLSGLNYVKISSVAKGDYSGGGYFVRNIPDSVVITEEGKSFLETYETEKIRYVKKYRLDILAIVIAALALIVSIIALLK